MYHRLCSSRQIASKGILAWDARDNGKIGEYQMLEISLFDFSVQSRYFGNKSALHYSDAFGLSPEGNATR